MVSGFSLRANGSCPESAPINGGRTYRDWVICCPPRTSAQLVWTGINSLMIAVCLESDAAQPIAIQCADSTWDLYRTGSENSSMGYFCCERGQQGFREGPDGPDGMVGCANETQFDNNSMIPLPIWVHGIENVPETTDPVLPSAPQNILKTGPDSPSNVWLAWSIAATTFGCILIVLAVLCYTRWKYQPFTSMSPYKKVETTEHLARSSLDSLGKKDNESQNLVKRPARVDWSGSWTWEVISLVFSILCTVFLAIFLHYVDGTDYNAWQHRLSPNTVVSVIVTVAKSAMLIPVSSCLGQLKWDQGQPGKPSPLYHIQVLDQASRGPWGSLEVCWRWKMKPGLATAGSFLMVASIAIVPLAQQLLTYPTVLRHSPAELAYAQSTHAYAFQSWGSIARVGTFQVDPSMQTAVLNALSQSFGRLEPFCSTNHCEYPDFTSLGVCSHCEDVTEVATQVCHEDNNITSKYRNGTSTPWDSVPTNCSYTSPNGFSIRPGLLSPLQVGTDSWVQLERQPWTSIVTTNVSRRQSTDLISFFSAKYQWPLVYTKENVTAKEEKPILTECALHWCEKLYDNNHFESKDHRSLDATRSQILVPKSRGDTVTLVPADGSQQLSLNASYTVNSITADQTNQLLRSVFDGTLIESTSMLAFSTNPATLNPVLYLYITPNLTDTVDQIATAMTEQIRSNPGSKGAYIRGKAYHDLHLIHVRWGWIALPATMAILVAVLLFATGVINQKRDAILWKSSILPLLFGPLQTQPEGSLTSMLGHVDEAVDQSKTINVMTESRHPYVVRDDNDAYK